MRPMGTGWRFGWALFAGLGLAMVVAAGAEGEERRPPRGPDQPGVDARMLADLEILRDLELLRQLDLLRKLDEVRSEPQTRGARTDERGKP